jgi:hypothetical protein
VGNAVVSRGDIVAALASAMPPGREATPEISLPLGLSRNEICALQRQAGRAGLGVQEYVRAALALTGAFDDDEEVIDAQ